MNRKRMLLSSISLIFITLFALMVWALNTSTTLSNVALVNPIAAQNVSGVLVVNISAAHLTGGDGNITNATITFQFTNGSQVGVYIVRDTDRSRNTSLSNATNSGENFFGGIDTALVQAIAGFREGIINVTNITAWNASESDTGGNQPLFTNVTVLKLSGSDSQQVPFIVDNTKPNIVGWNVTNKTNYTTYSLINLTVTVTNNTLGSDGTPLGHFSGTDIHMVTLQISNNSNPFNLSATLKNGGGALAVNRSYNFTFNGSNYGLLDGNMTATLFINDTAGNLNQSNTLIFLYDRTAPNVVQLYNITESYNSSDTTPWFVWQVNDSFSPTMVCGLYINGTLNVSNLNVTNGSSATFEVGTAIPEGHYNWSVSCNDSGRFMNSSHVRNFTIDATSPSATVTCTPSSVTVSGSVSCSCSSSDSLSGVASTSFSDTAPSTSSAGSLTTGACTVTDNAGNTASATGSYTVTAAAESTGGSGGSGSGGGIASGKTGQFEKKTWASILAGEKATVTVANGVLGVTSIDFVVEKTTYGATMQVKKVDALPSSVKAFSAKKYKTLDISQTNVEKALSGNAIINFKVEKKWLADNNLGSNAVAMFHYKDNAWVELKTTIGQDDGTYVHFTAETPGFSYFVIGQKTGVAAPVAEKKAAPSAAPTSVTEPSEATAEEVVAEEPSSSSAAVWVIVGLVLVGLLAWAVMALRRRR